MFHPRPRSQCRRLATAALAVAAACQGCGPAPVPPPSEPADSVAAIRLAPRAETAPVTADSPAAAAFLTDSGGPMRILAAAGLAGLEVYAPDGTRAAAIDGLDAGLVSVVPGAGDRGPLVVVYDGATARLRGFRLEDGAAAAETLEAFGVADELTGLCHYRSRLSGSDYLFAVTDGGMIHQFELYSSGDRMRARLLRSIPSGKGTGFCDVDPRDGTLYVSEEASGVWRLGAEPESDTSREPVDLRRPFGTLSDDLKGLAVYPAGSDLSYLVVADAGDGRLAIYSLPDAVRAATIEVEGVDEPEGMAATNAEADGAWPGGALAVADESADGEGPSVAILPWRDIAQAAGLRAGTTAERGRRPAVVRPVSETDIMPSFGDAADDPAVWVDPSDPSRSLVIGTDKQSGLFVFDLDGRALQHLPDGQMNNVDLRDGFRLGGERVTLVTASNRSTDSIAAYRIDPVARRLVAVASGTLATGFDDPYGLCMYRSASSGETYVFVNEGEVGTIRQWRLLDDGAGRVTIEQVREFAVGSQAEGCVADDESGRLYVAEEDRGVWRYSAEPNGGDARVAIDTTGDGGRLTEDVEGVSLWKGGDGKGYLVVSNQGADNYAVYRREGDNAFVGFFHVVADPDAGIDGASETDGLDVVGAALGDAYPAGLLVVQDGRNIAPEERQNFKYVSWADVAAALGLEAVGGRE